LRYTEVRDGNQRKRKASIGSVSEEAENGEQKSQTKRLKTGEACEDVAGHRGDKERRAVTSTEQAEITSKQEQAKLVNIAKEAVASQDVVPAPNVAKAPTVGMDSTMEVPIHLNGEAGVEGGTEEAIDKPQDSTEAMDIATGQAPSADSRNVAEERVEAVSAAKPALEKSSIALAPAKTKKIAKPIGDPKAILTGLNATKTSDSPGSTTIDYEKVRSTFEKINQERLGAIKGCADMLKQKSTLLEQISQHQHEIDGLKTALSQQNARHLAEVNKQKDAGQHVGAEKTAMKLEKQDFEAKIGRLMQKIDELAKVASTANEETSAVKARVRGQQNRVAELEKQVAIMKQVEDGRKKELGETRQQNVVLQRQNTDLEAKIVNWETEVTGLRREMATINVENTQLRAAVVQRVLSTPKSQGPEPASDSAAKREEDF
jgi:hypothetical protein